MKADSQRPKQREADLNAAIQAMSLAKTSTILPAKAVFSSVTALLTSIRVWLLLFRKICSRFTPSQDSMINEVDCVELGLSCADVCRMLDQGTNGKKQEEFSLPVYDAINQLAL